MPEPSRKTTRKRPSESDRLIDAALTLAAERGWREVAMADIAKAAKVPLSKVYPLFASRQAILAAYARRVDAAVLAEEEADAEALAGSSARDRLFDVMMRRFDIMRPHRLAIANIAHDGLSTPLRALAGMPQLLRSMAWMLEAAAIPTDGLTGLLRVKGLAWIYLASLRVWLRDDSSDLARTMAALDGYLRRVEWLAVRLEGRRRPRRPAEDAAAP
jgi:AcrR family transcriptional regulator